MKTHQPLMDVLYKSEEGLSDYERARCRMDVYPADAVGPLLLWIHGGGLTEGDKSNFAHFAQYLAKAGIAVALCNYRFHPHVRYPAYLDDAAAALNWVHLHSENYQTSAEQIFIGGHSAGAYLAALLALKPDATPVPIRGVIPISGQMVTHFTVRAERGYPTEQIVVDEAAPLFNIAAEAAPFCILVAEDDIPARLEENQYFAAMMKATGHRHTELHVVSKRDHSSIADCFGQDGDPVALMILDFIRRQR